MCACVSARARVCVCVCVCGEKEAGEEGSKRSFVGMLAAPFRPVKKRINLLSFLLFLRDSHLIFSSIPVILPVSEQ